MAADCGIPPSPTHTPSTLPIHAPSHTHHTRPPAHPHARTHTRTRGGKHWCLLFTTAGVGRAGSSTAIVKFDKQYAYGEKEDAWKAFATDMAPTSVLVAEVGVQDYGDKENDDLRERFGVSADDFPVFKLFNGEGEPTTYSGDVTGDALKLWAKEATGVWIGLEGCVEEFDKIAIAYSEGSVSADAGATQAAAALGEVTADEAKTKAGKMYKRIFEKIVEKGAGFPASETTRVKGLLEGKLSDAKKATLKTRLNILASFKVPAKTEL